MGSMIKNSNWGQRIGAVMSVIPPFQPIGITLLAGSTVYRWHKNSKDSKKRAAAAEGMVKSNKEQSEGYKAAAEEEQERVRRMNLFGATQSDISERNKLLK